MARLVERLRARRLVSPSRIRWVAPSLIVLVGAYWTALTAYRSTFAILGRDPGIFQYVAWALGRGEVDYVDIREINGPLPHFIHLVFQHLGGEDEHVFRILDLVAQSAVFALAGALLPGIGDTERRSAPGDGRPARPARALWAAAAWVTLMAQYLILGWWQTAQRESFYDLFILSSVTLQLVAQRSGAGRRRAALFIAAGALSALPWFGKPTNLVFSALQVSCVIFDRDSTPKRREALGWFAAGCAATGAVMLGLLFEIGAPIRGARIVLDEAPRMYRWVWKLSFADCYTIWHDAPKLNYALATLAPVACLIAAGRLPRRFLLVSVIAAGGMLNFFLQAKGFPYHLHPVTLGTHYLWLAIATYLTEAAAARRTTTARVRWPWILPTAALVGAALIGAQSADEARLSDYYVSDWWRVGATAEGRASEPYFRAFPWGDYFPWDLRVAARFLQEHTGPDDRVQTYGLDPYLLFLARRRSATPFIYGFDLNVDAALQGGSGGVPSEADRAWLLDIARQHRTELLGGLERRPPAAFAFIDRAPFTYPPDSEADFESHCPEAAAWMRQRYHEAARLGAVRIWLRDGVAVEPVR